jgi:hypothetical protein
LIITFQFFKHFEAILTSGKSDRSICTFFGKIFRYISSFAQFHFILYF